MMTKEDAVTLAENILRCGDVHIGAGMILGALALERKSIISMIPPYQPAVGTTDPNNYVGADGKLHPISLL